MNHLNSQQNSYSLLEEKYNALTHGAGLVAALVGLVFMLMKAQGAYAQGTVWVYGCSLILMFLSSTLYHSVERPLLKAKLKKIDHISIYLLIAGTYTPFMLLAVSGSTGFWAMWLIWGIAGLGIVFKSLAHKKLVKLSVLTYLLMGWLAVFYIYPLYQALPSAGFYLLLAGGLSYTLGVGFYVAKSRQFTHAIWHMFVVAGCACHFFAIYLFVI
ncbi:PAQR family membrane homeostasis protein TrhA [Paraglaciecola aestuariivivens]